VGSCSFQWLKSKLPPGGRLGSSAQAVAPGRHSDTEKTKANVLAPIGTHN